MRMKSLKDMISGLKFLTSNVKLSSGCIFYHLNQDLLCDDDLLQDDGNHVIMILQKGIVGAERDFKDPKDPQACSVRSG